MPTVDMTGVPVGFQPIPDQDTAKVAFTGFKNMKNKNNEDMARLELTVVTPEEYAGHKLFMNQNITVQGLPFLKEIMVKLGADPADLEDVLNTDEIFNDLIGNECAAAIGHREYQGKTFNEVTLLTDNSW